MERHIIMDEASTYWGNPRWQVIDVNERGTGAGPIMGWAPADTAEQALVEFETSMNSRPWDSEARPGRVRILVLSPNTGPTERWLKSEWYTSKGE